MVGQNEIVVSCVSQSQTRSSDLVNRSVIITTTGDRPLQIQIVGNHTLASTKGTREESKTVISTKKRQIETRVQRQVVLEDDKIVADTGPQVITRTLEDFHTEDSTGDSSRPTLALTNGLPNKKHTDPDVIRSVSRTRTSQKSASKEVSHYHDEQRREVTGEELEKALETPQILLEKIDNNFPDEIRGELMFYSNKSKSVLQKENIDEISKLDQDGNIRTSITNSRHEEVHTSDELPEEFAPQELPEPTPTSTNELTDVDWNVKVLPVHQETFEEKVQKTHLQSESLTSKSDKRDGKYKPHSDPFSRESKSWAVERVSKENGETELLSIRRSGRAPEKKGQVWDKWSSMRTSDRIPKSSPDRQRTPINRRVLDANLAKASVTSNRRIAERRQRSLFLGADDRCPAPPATQSKEEEECHYELLWNAHTGEKRSPSPNKSETFTKARGKRIAQLLASRNEKLSKKVSSSKRSVK